MHKRKAASLTCLQQEGFLAPTMFLMLGTQTRILLRILIKTVCIYIRGRSFALVSTGCIFFKKKNKSCMPLLRHKVY